MQITVENIIALAQALEPIVVPTAEAIVGAIKGSGAMSADQIDADLQALIVEALAAKAEADKAASGNDPR